jgi:hypothetical protein
LFGHNNYYCHSFDLYNICLFTQVSNSKGEIITNR